MPPLRFPPRLLFPPQGKEPLLYVTVLLLSLQFHEALRFLWKDETTKMYRVDAVHLAIAMHQEQALTLSSGTDVWGEVEVRKRHGPWMYGGLGEKRHGLRMLCGLIYMEIGE